MNILYNSILLSLVSESVGNSISNKMSHKKLELDKNYSSFISGIISSEYS